MGSQRSHPIFIACTWLSCLAARVVAQGGSFSAPNFCTPGNTTSCSGFPSGICCATGYSCAYVPTNHIAVFCCAPGNNCTTVAPVDCKSSSEIVPANLNNQSYVLTPSGLGGSCGNGCCPVGFACQDGTCQLEQASNTTSTNSTTSTSSSSASSSSSTFTTSSSTNQNATAGANQLSTSPATATVFVTMNSTSNNAGTIAGAVVGGVAGLAILVGGAIFLLARKRRQAGAAKSSSDDTNEPEKHPDALLKKQMAEMDAPIGPSEIDSGSVYELQHGDQENDPATKAARESQRRQRLSRMFEIGPNRRSEVHELP